MKNLSKKEWVAVSISIVFIAYMFFSDSIVGIFNNPDDNSNNMAQVSQINTEGNNNPQVQTQDVVVGNGVEIKQGMQVSVNYVLRLADGTLIQDSKQVGGGEPFQFVAGAGQLIPGWEMGILGMRVGGKRIIIIPPSLGYGSQPVGPIPANSTLIFDIEVVSAK